MTNGIRKDTYPDMPPLPLSNPFKTIMSGRKDLPKIKSEAIDWAFASGDRNRGFGGLGSKAARGDYRSSDRGIDLKNGFGPICKSWNNRLIADV